MAGKSSLGALLALIVFVGLLAAGQSLAHEWMAPKEAAQQQNPVIPDENSLRSGKMSYQENCAACHGDQIRGLKGEQTGLDTDTPNLKERLKNHSDGDFFWKINEGRGEMPSFKEELSDEQKWQIINYIRNEAE